MITVYVGALLKSQRSESLKYVESGSSKPAYNLEIQKNRRAPCDLKKLASAEIIQKLKFG